MVEHKKLEYRPDIDGLRAIAVLAVLFYHAGIKYFSGGYVGVDVFFVISGYLITKKISENLYAGRFSIIEFYERRIRRIFPALFTTILVTLLLGAWLYDAPTYQELGQSTTATALFFSNIFFYNQAGYFDSPSALKPLLHMWSLSVEEQFYFLLPLVLYLLFRFFRKNPRLVLAVIAGASLIASIIMLRHNPESVFFLTQYRIWELVLGSLIALSKFGNTKSSVRNLASGTGFALILISIILYSDQTPFPGPAASIPVIGSGLIIIAGIGDETFAGRLLSTGPMVLIGKISYSLYLWHWPFLVFGRVYSIEKLGTPQLLAWFGLTFFVAYLSWKYIETPFRSLTFLAKPRIFYLAAAVMALITLAGYTITVKEGITIRLPNEHKKALLKDNWHFEGGLWLECNSEGEDQPLICPIGAENQPRSFLFWGDSHANALGSAVHRSALNSGRSGQMIWRTGCQPLMGIDRSGHADGECSQSSYMVLDYIDENQEIETVILASRWAITAVGTRYKSEEGYPVFLTDSERPDSEISDNEEIFKTGLERTVDELIRMGKEVVIVAPVPEVGYHVPSAYFTALRTGRDINSLIAPSLEEYHSRNAVPFKVITEIASRYPQVTVVDPAEILCNVEFCQVIRENQPLYIDDDHLSSVGAYLISVQFDPVFQE